MKKEVACTLQYSTYQTAIFNFLKTSQQSLAIEAVAGSGKTTTLIEAASVIETKSVAFLAFNKAIADELKRRLPPKVDVKTFNAVGHAALCKTGAKFNNNKLQKIMDDIKPNIPFNLRKYMSDIFRLVNLAKSEGIIPKAKGVESVSDSLMPDNDETWRWLVQHHGMNVAGEREDIIDGVWGISRAALIETLRMKNEFDFSDQIYFPFVFGMELKTYKVLFVDEAQDVSRIQHYFIDKMMDPVDGRLIVCGDSHQAIYGFRGADSESIQRLTEKYKCKTLPLSISYRCPKSVIEQAQRFVPSIEAMADAPQGSVQTYENLDLGKLSQEDMVLSRFNAILIRIALKLLERNIKFNYQGEDLTKEIVGLIKRSRASNIRTLISSVEGTINEASKAIEEAYDPNKLTRLIDVCRMCLAFIKIKNVTDVDSLIEYIQIFFQQSKIHHGGVRLSTIHRAKGLESNRVFIAELEQKGEKKVAKQAWIEQQENNLSYVAITRSKNELHFIIMKDDEEDRPRKEYSQGSKTKIRKASY